MIELIRGIYSSALGMMVQQKRQDVVAENLLNANTPGYKRDIVVFKPFPEVLLNRIGDNESAPAGQPIGRTNWGVEVAEVFPVMLAGDVVQTGNNTDLALAEEGLTLFAIDTPDGIRYTRRGDFRVNVEGFLVTGEGFSVLGRDGPLQVRNQDFVVTTAGVVRVGDEVVDHLTVTSFDSPRDLQRVGSNQFMAVEGANPRQNPPQGLMQGTLEESNAQSVTEMATMIDGLRAYEANLRMLRTQDELLGKAVNDLGSVR